MPGVMNCYVLAREVAAYRRLVATIAYSGQPHESGGMAGPAAERPPSGNAIAARNGLSQADRAGGADDERTGVGEPLTRNGHRQIASDAAHAAAICHDPAD